MARIGCKIFGAPDLLTRVFPADYLVSYTYGHFRFGTLSGYARGEGRFSDKEEGHRLRSYDARFVGNARFGLVEIIDTSFGGNNEGDIQIVDRVDVPVACLSLGGYDISRAHAIMARNSDLKRASYVVYDSRQLIEALSTVLARNEWFHDIRAGGKSGMVGMRVNYDRRATREPLTDQSGGELEHDDITRMIWTKPPLFAHEDEYRIALFGTSIPHDSNGLLANGIVVEQSRAIAGCIVEFGDVPPP